MTNEELVAAIRNGDLTECNGTEQLYRQNEGVLRKYAAKYADVHTTFDDLMQEGNFALISAVRSFDQDAGVKLLPILRLR